MMIFSVIFFLFSSAAPSVDTAVASAVERTISVRTNAVHEIEYRSVPRELVHIDPRATVRVIDEPRATYRGSFSMPVEVRPASGSCRRYMLSLKVRTFESVAVAAATIDRHSEIRPAQIIMQNIETTHMSSSLMTDAGGMRGMRTRQIIAAGAVITGSMIEPLPLIATGSPVTVSVREENVTLSVMGTARTDGWQGTIIPVEVAAIRRHLKAKVVDAHNVEVVEK